ICSSVSVNLASTSAKTCWTSRSATQLLTSQAHRTSSSLGGESLAMRSARSIFVSRLPIVTTACLSTQLLESQSGFQAPAFLLLYDARRELTRPSALPLV